MMRVDTRPRKRNSPRPAEKSAPGFLQWLRGRDCCVRADCQGKMEAAHVDYAGGKGVATKVSDRFAVPMCARHHAIQHREGWKTFEQLYFGKPGECLKISEAFWKAWPGRIAWERKLEERQ